MLPFLAMIARNPSWVLVLLALSVAACGADSSSSSVNQPATGAAGDSSGGAQSGDGMGGSNGIAGTDGVGDAGRGGGDGVGGSSSTDATIAGTTLPLPDACAELGWEISFGCEDCPIEPPECECLVLGRDLLLPEQSCTWGKCLVAYDCERLCLNLEDMEALLGQDVMAASQCKNAMARCTNDAECGRGRCRDVTSTEPGYCSGGPYEACETEADCQEGLRCVHQPTGQCLPPIAETCNDASHCVEGSNCVIYQTDTLPSGETVDIGACSTGEVGETCTENQHCVEPYLCMIEPGVPRGECGEVPQVP